ncbi:oxidoreductase [Niveibacterium sp. 24ML]|uniref:oxidoreductase n=1 Tax=Niveibacterium sp. 24ML TaxID=2985512 RepID=UPI0022718982|nr:oxidoreductase [Niveibacterium sp. 24ML]MCX9156462.1 oxidoreductase [Niveibacterium sp. 24ML]
MTRHRSALIAGASGLVGQHLLSDLLHSEAYGRVIALVRRPLAVQHEKLEQRVVDFARLAEAPALAADDVFCCLGTTIRVAGSEAAFRAVDHDYPLALARLAHASGAQRFLIVSALGADAASKVFYNRVKGETERDIAALGMPACWYLRPSLLDGARTELRPGERIGLLIGRIVAPLMRGSLARYRPIGAATVARAMLRIATRDAAAPGVVESEVIARLGA